MVGESEPALVVVAAAAVVVEPAAAVVVGPAAAIVVEPAAAVVVEPAAAPTAELDSTLLSLSQLLQLAAPTKLLWLPGQEQQRSQQPSSAEESWTPRKTAFAAAGTC